MFEIQFEDARHKMVISQLRTFEVLDDRLLDVFERAPRQDFVPAECRNLAFADMQLPLGHGEMMMAPLVEARLLQALAINPTDKVLEIGTGSGYVSYLLAQLAARVHSVEIIPEFTQRASEKLAAHGATNVELEIGDGARGWDRHAPYDAIFVTGSLPVVPVGFRNNLAIGGRLAVIVGDDPVMEAQIVTRLSATGFETQSLFDTRIPPLRNALTPEKFVF
ncbi:MAG: protein-L-isoaspartate O-methyltransferase [Chromatiales bacterium]|nr:protein-L-isoaspartate O-methyltransferase [Chromatiales bacterium]